MLNKKSIVLSDTKEGSNKKAVLSLEEDGAGITGTLRLYNFPRELDGICSLGFYVGGQVIKAGLTLKSHMLYQFFINLKQIPKDFSVAVVNFQNAVATPILYGSSEGNDEDIYGSIISDISQSRATVASAKAVLDKYGVDFDEEEKKTIEKEIDKNLCGGDCANCVYKKFFFENSIIESAKKSVEPDEEMIEKGQSNKEEESFFDQPQKVEEKKSEPLFFDRLKPQIDKLFENNPIENNLQNLIPSSKWVKVEYEDDGDFYVFGLLYDDEQNVKYVCYGIPAVFDEEPPKELAGFPIWLPLDQKEGFGYWLTYQDATTGEPIKAIMD